MNHCIAPSVTGEIPNCSGRCSSHKIRCPYWFEDPLWAVINQWKQEAHVEDAVLYKVSYSDMKLMIGTTKPGYLIGYQGQLIDKYREKIRPLIDSGISAEENFINLTEYTEIV